MRRRRSSRSIPTWTPDQVKGAADGDGERRARRGAGSGGVGEIQTSRRRSLKSARRTRTLALNQYLVSDLVDGPSRSTRSAGRTRRRANVSWDAVSWDAAAWTDASWSASPGQRLLGDAVSWADVSWADVSLGGQLATRTRPRATAAGRRYELTPEQAAEIMADPEIAPAADELPADVSAGSRHLDGGGGTPCGCRD